MEVGRQLRRDARRILRAAIDAANPAEAVTEALRKFRGIDRFRRIYVVGAGKASGTMARAAERVLGRRIFAGCVNVKDGERARCRRVELRPAGHPVPDERGVAGARRIAELAAKAGAGDLVLCLISGGASALMPLPASAVTLEAKQETTKLLLACGATIHQLNCVRKHLSAIKGGRLARLASPARVVSLIVSDVVGDDLDTIGSGPTAADQTTFADAVRVLDGFGLRDRVPGEVRAHLEAGVDETPKSVAAVNRIVVSNRASLQAAAACARELGYRPMILSSTMEGETRDIAAVHADIAREIRVSGQPVRPPCCVISGGETTVTVRGAGRGGRNQEFALAAALRMQGLPGVVVLSAGTDGIDGPTPAAGAIVDGATVTRSHRDARAALDANNSYGFFEGSGDLIVTGPTGTNVMDIHLILAAAC